MMTQKMMREPKLQDVTPAMVRRAYGGQAGKCMCGCAGKYFEMATSPKRATELLRLLQANEDKVEYGAGLFGEFYFSADLGKRRYTVYLHAGAV